MPTRETNKRLYLISGLSEALNILELVQRQCEPMAVEAVHRQTRMSETSVYRVLETLVRRGYLSKSPDGLYRHMAQTNNIRFGVAGQSADMPFSGEVTDSLRGAAMSGGVDLVILDNKNDAATALENAEEFVRSDVDLVIDFQADEKIAAMVADKIAAAHIPLIAVNTPHPHATYFGVDTYRVGVDSGQALADYAVRHWARNVDWVLGLDLQEPRQLVQSIITGAFAGIRGGIPEIPIESFIRMDSRGMRDLSKQLVAEFLTRHIKDEHMLIAAATSSSALGAVDAVNALKHVEHVVIVGQHCIAETMAEMRKPRSSLIATVSHEPSSYGPALIHLGLLLLRGQRVPPYNYVEHKLVTREALKQELVPTN